MIHKLKKTEPAIKAVRRGEIYYARFSECIGSEQKGQRPVLILQNNVGNRYSPTTIVASITASTQKIKKANLPIHVFLPRNISKLSYDSIILFEQIRTIDKQRLLHKISTLDLEFMKSIDEKIMISLGIHPDFKI